MGGHVDASREHETLERIPVLSGGALGTVFVLRRSVQTPASDKSIGAQVQGQAH